MALRLDQEKVGEVSRGDVLYIKEPEKIVVDTGFNARMWQEMDDVDDLAESIRRYGQQQPAIVRKLADGRLQLIAGFRRWKAVMKLNQEAAEGEKYSLQVVERKRNDDESFFLNVEENLRRKTLSPVDVATICRRMQEQMGMSDDEVALRLDKSPAWVRQHLKILALSTPEQKRVHKGEIAAATAFELADMDPEKRKEVIAELPNDGKIKGSTVTKKAREKAAHTGPKSRSVKELREYFDARIGAPGMPKAVQKLAEWMIKFINGETDENDLDRIILRYTVKDEENK